MHFLTTVERARLPELLAATTALDLRGVMSYGLFDADNRYLLGDIDQLPPDLPVDGNVHALPHGVRRLSGQHGVAPAASRCVATESGRGRRRSINAQ